jgi:hypothetical protein
MFAKIRAWAASFRRSRRISAPCSRRTFWQATAGTVALTPFSPLRAQTNACALACKSTFEAPVASLPPLDCPVVWQRRHTAASGPGATHGILSLVAESATDTAYPWPLYIQLTTSHNHGDAAGASVRLTQTGNGWGAAFHTDLYHQGGGTSIGANVEVTKKTDAGRAIGVNIQSKGAKTDEAIHIQTAPSGSQEGSWETGVHFEKSCKGNRAIWIEGAWDTGLDLGANSLAMAAGSRVYLEDTRQVSLTFNAEAKRVEFRHGDSVIGYLALDQPPHQL